MKYPQFSQIKRERRIELDVEHRAEISSSFPESRNLERLESPQLATGMIIESRLSSRIERIGEAARASWLEIELRSAVLL